MLLLVGSHWLCFPVNSHRLRSSMRSSNLTDLWILVDGVYHPIQAHFRLSAWPEIRYTYVDAAMFLFFYVFLIFPSKAQGKLIVNIMHCPVINWFLLRLAHRRAEREWYYTEKTNSRVKWFAIKVEMNRRKIPLTRIFHNLKTNGISAWNYFKWHIALLRESQFIIHFIQCTHINTDTIPYNNTPYNIKKQINLVWTTQSNGCFEVNECFGAREHDRRSVVFVAERNVVNTTKLQRYAGATATAT